MITTHLKLILFITLLVTSIVLFAQDDTYVYGDYGAAKKKNELPKGFDWEKVTIGGTLGASFGSDQTYFEIAPQFGYFLTENILIGVGGNYTYFEDRQFDVSTSLYGARIFSQYVFEELPILAHVEGELINIELFGSSFNSTERVNIYNFYVGSGLKQNLGGSSYIYILALFNLNETEESRLIQFNPIIRGGIAIGL